MKRMTATIAALALTLCVLTGAAGWAEEKQTAANLFEFDGHGILVSVDLHDGWSIEFGLNATYLFDGENDGNRDAAAYGVYVSPEEYEEIIDEYSGYDSFREIEGGVAFTEEDGLGKYVFSVCDGVYYMIMATPGIDAADIYGRFDVSEDPLY